MSQYSRKIALNATMISRRRLLGILATSAVSAGLLPRAVAAQSANANAARRVVVIGAGIVGCSIAWHLARRGCQVTMLEAREPAAQASGHSFAWINAGDASQPLSYHVLRAYALGEHRRLAGELPWPVRWSGSLEWTAGEGVDVADNVRRMQARGADLRLIGPSDVRHIEPGLIVDAGTALSYAPHDGALDAGRATRVLFDAALKSGARAVLPARVVGLEVDRASPRVLTEVGNFEADTFVVAAGIGASAIAAMAGLTLTQKTTPGIIAITQPMGRVVSTVLYGPQANLHQRHDGRVVIGEKGGPPAIDAHQVLTASYPNRFPNAELEAQHGARLLAAASSQLPALNAARIRQIGIGWRPMPADGLPVLGRPRVGSPLYFAVMHSGMTLAPLIGRLVSTELLDDVELAVLSEFRYRTMARQ